MIIDQLQITMGQSMASHCIADYVVLKTFCEVMKWASLAELMASHVISEVKEQYLWKLVQSCQSLEHILNLM